MRPTATLLGGGDWGSMSRQNGIITYGMSPYRQRVFKGFFFPGIFNNFSRYLKLAPYVLPPALVAWYTLDWAEKRYEYYNRKEYKLTHGVSH